MTSPDIIGSAIVAGFILGGVGLLFFFAWWGNRSLTRGFAPLIEHMGFRHRTDAEGKMVPEVIEGARHNRPARIQFHHGGRGDPGRMSFALDHPLSVEIAVHVYPRRWYHRLATAIGLVRHVAHGHGRFHQGAHVESEDDNVAEMLAKSDVFREEVLPLLRYPGAAVTVEPTGVALTLRRCHSRRRKRALRIRNVESIFRSLAGASDSLSRGRIGVADSAPADRRLSGDGIPTPSAFGGGRPTRGLVLASACLFFAGPLFLWWGSRYPTLTWDLHLTGFAVGGGVALASSLLTFRAVRGRSKALSEFGLFALWAIVGYPTFAAGLLCVVNGLPDRADPMTLPSVIVKKEDSPSLRVALELPDGAVVRQSLRVSRQLYRQAEPGTWLAVEVKPGILGQPWLRGLADATAAPPLPRPPT